LLAGDEAGLVRPRYLEDNLLFDDVSRSLTAVGRVLRVRRTPRRAWLTYKAPIASQGCVKEREEIETEVDDPDALVKVLERLGFSRAFRYQKYRELYSLAGTEVALDETPIGVYLEVEGEPEAIHAVAARLGFGRADYITESYVGLFFASGAQGDMVFR